MHSGAADCSDKAQANNWVSLRDASASFALPTGRFSGGRNLEEVETDERRALELA